MGEGGKDFIDREGAEKETERTEIYFEQIVGQSSCQVQTEHSSKVMRSLFGVGIFHLLCWTPFWVFALVPMLSNYELFETFIENWMGSPSFDVLRMSSRFRFAIKRA